MGIPRVAPIDTLSWLNWVDVKLNSINWISEILLVIATRTVLILATTLVILVFSEVVIVTFVEYVRKVDARENAVSSSPMLSTLTDIVDST